MPNTNIMYYFGVIKGILLESSPTTAGRDSEYISTTNLLNSDVVAKLCFLNQTTSFKHPRSPPPLKIGFYANRLFMCFKLFSE